MNESHSGANRKVESIADIEVSGGSNYHRLCQPATKMESHMKWILSAQEIIPIGSPSDWKQFGLAGLVIFALFVFTGLLTYWLMRRFDSTMTEHRAERQQWLEANNKARGEHLDALRELSRATVDALKSNTTSIEALRSEFHDLNLNLQQR